MYSEHPSQGSGGGDVGRQGSVPACLFSSPASLYPLEPVEARPTPGSGLAQARQAGPEQQIRRLRAPSGPSAPVPSRQAPTGGAAKREGVPCSNAGPSCGSQRRGPGLLQPGEVPLVEAGPLPGEDPEVGTEEGEGGAERTGAAAACSSCSVLSLLGSREWIRRAPRSDWGGTSLASGGSPLPNRLAGAPSSCDGW